MWKWKKNEVCVCYLRMNCVGVGGSLQVYLSCSSRKGLLAVRTERVVRMSWSSLAAFGSRPCKAVAESETSRPTVRGQMERWKAARWRSGPDRANWTSTIKTQNAERCGKVKRSVLQTCDRLHVNTNQQHFYLRVWRNFHFAFDFACFGFKLFVYILRSCKTVFIGERRSGSALVLR